MQKSVGCGSAGGLTLSCNIASNASISTNEHTKLTVFVFVYAQINVIYLQCQVYVHQGALPWILTTSAAFDNMTKEDLQFFEV